MKIYHCFILKGNTQLISSPTPSIGVEVNEMLDDGSSTVV